MTIIRNINRPTPTGIYSIITYTRGATHSLPARSTYLEAETAARNAVRLGASWAHIRNVETGAVIRVIERS